MTLPGSLQGWDASGVNAPCSASAGDGAIWWGCTMKSASGIAYCVWRELPTNVFTLIWHGPPTMHRATMQAGAGGALVVTTYTGAGDRQNSERIVIPGYVPVPPLVDAALGARVEVLERLCAALQATVLNHQRTIDTQAAALSAIESELTDIQIGGSGGALSGPDRSTLDWAAAIRALLRSEA